MVEAVVALAVVAIVLASIGSLYASTATGARTLEQHVALVDVARLIETEIPRDIPPGGLAGEMLGHRWQVRTAPYFDGGPAMPGSPWIPQRVLLRVQAPSGAALEVESVTLRKRVPVRR